MSRWGSSSGILEDFCQNGSEFGQRGLDELSLAHDRVRARVPGQAKVLGRPVLNWNVLWRSAKIEPPFMLMV
jgi:hypothetical protein